MRQEEAEFDLCERTFANGRVAEVFLLLFGRARLGLRDAGSLTYEEVW